MKPTSNAAGKKQSPKRKIFVVDRTRYLPDGSICPTSPSKPWAVFEDTQPVTLLGQYVGRDEAFSQALVFETTPAPQ